MSDKEQAYVMFKQFTGARQGTPWVANWFMALAEKEDLWMGPRRCLDRLGGLMGEW